MYGVETVALRYVNVYGPGQTGGDYAGVIAALIKQARTVYDITVHGDGNQPRDFVYVDDVVDANIAAMRADHVGEAYNIGTGTSVSIRELAELILELTDTNSEIVHTDPREGDIDHSAADITKAQQHIDYNPTVSLREGLQRTIAWWQSDPTTTKQQ